jgi:hypothetical protein
MKMTGRKRIIIAIAVIIPLISILFGILYHQENEKRMIDEFEFKLTFNTFGKDVIDTYNNTYTKDLVLDGTKTIFFEIPFETKKEIYYLLKEVNISEFPENIDLPDFYTSPECTYHLSAVIDGKSISVNWENGLYSYDGKIQLPDLNIRFLRVIEYVSAYIYSTEEYRKMPEAKGGYD